MRFRELTELPVQGKSVFLRLDLNVPLKDGVIQDDTRIREALPTLKYLLEKTNKVVVASHLGRPKTAEDKQKLSLEPIGIRLAELLGKELIFIRDYEKKPVDQMLLQLEKNQFILLENLRFYEQETKNDPGFSEVLRKGIDFYVNDAFGAIHRAHASTVGLPEKMESENRAIGFLIKKELEALDALKRRPQAPYSAVLGGAKVADKIDVLFSLAQSCNHILIGGAMAYTFLKYKGVSVGSSILAVDKDKSLEAFYQQAEARRVQVHLPVDHVCAETFDEKASPRIIEGAIPAGWMGLDIGPKTLALYRDILKSSKTIFWNGPLGVFEWPAFSHGTIGIAKAIAESGAYSLAGGGESVSAIHMAGVDKKFSHISTGGGASLEYLEGKVLPGLKVLSSLKSS
ncbi:MAG: phosphoglycerate kinase [Oligoflexales bacterium]|nr:phosphoglycerate kinase [Oligoflexales bacterium]